MMRFILIAVLFLSVRESFAQKIRVQKVKGKQAVIEYSGGTLVPGQIYQIGDNFDSTEENAPAPRRYYFDMSANFISVKSDAANSSETVTNMSATTSLGWNFGDFEAGPALAFSTTSSGGTTSSSFLFGAYADWNIIPNISGEAFLYGVGMLAAAGQGSYGNSESSTTFLLQPVLFAKWFFGNTNTGVRMNLGFRYQKYGDFGATGVMGGAALITYF